MDIGFSEDYVTFLTHKYNLSAKVEEYILNGIATITGTQGDKKMIVEDSEHPSGICVNPLNEDNYSGDVTRYINDLANSFLELIKNPKLLAKLKYNALIEGRNRFSKNKIISTIKEVFDNLFHQ
jgi:hypothetical protein